MNENRFLVICWSSGWNNWTSKAVKIIDTGVAIGPNVVGSLTSQLCYRGLELQNVTDLTDV